MFVDDVCYQVKMYKFPSLCLCDGCAVHLRALQKATANNHVSQKWPNLVKMMNFQYVNMNMSYNHVKWVCVLTASYEVVVRSGSVSAQSGLMPIICVYIDCEDKSWAV